MFAAFLSVFGLPAALLEPAIDNDAVALAEILPAMFRLFPEHHDVDETDFFLEFIPLLNRRLVANPKLATGVPLGV